MDRMDEFFRNKMEQRLPEFNKAHWQAAETMLEQRDRRRALWWWRIGLLVHVLSVVLILLCPSFHTSLQSFPVSLSTGELPATESNLNNADVLQPESEKPVAPAAENTPVAAKQAATSELESALTFIGSSNNSMPPGAVAPMEDPSQQPMATATLPSVSAFANDTPPGGKTTNSAVKVTVLRPVPSLATGLLEIGSASLDSLRRVTSTDNKAPLQWRYGVFAGLLGYPDAGDGATTGLQGGVAANLALGRGWGLQFRAAYRQQGLAVAPLQQQTSKQYSFGSSEQSYGLAPARLHYAEAGASAWYGRGRHRLGLGLDLSYLLGVEGELLLAERAMGQPLIGPARTIRQGWISREGLAEWVPAWQLSYMYALHPRLSVEATYHGLFRGIGEGVKPVPQPAFFSLRLHFLW